MNLKIVFVLIAVFLVKTLLASDECPHFISSENICAKLEWVEGPLYDNYSKAKMTFWNKADSTRRPVSLSKEIDIYPWMVMPNMEHGARPVVINELGPGVYEISKIYFVRMDGNWEMRVRYRGEDRRTKFLLKERIIFN